MAKKIISLFLAVLMVLSLSACKKTLQNESTTNGKESDVTADLSANVALLKGPTGMGGALLMQESADGKNKFNITLETDATVVGPKLMKGELDIAAVPTNLAASLYQKSEGKVKVVAINTLGVLYIVTKDGALSSVADLKGKTILASGQGTIAEYALNYVLESNNLVVGEDVTIEFTTEHSESVTKAMQGSYDAVLLPEPFVTQLTTKNSSYTVAIDITSEWEKTGDCTLTMGCIAVNAQFYEENKDAVKAFVEAYARSVEYVNDNIDDGAKLIGENGIMDEAVAKKAIPNANIVCITGSEMKQKLTSCYEVLFNQNAQIIGGKMPADDFYIDING